MSQGVRARHEQDITRRAYARQSERTARARRTRRTRLLWVSGAALLAALVTGMLLSSTSTSGTASGMAPAFTLPSTSGGSVSLADYAGESVLLFFNEGAGCDACFYQMAEIEKNLAKFEELGLSVVPIAANPSAELREQLDRFELETPWLSDTSVEVSNAYGVVGKGMHAGLPGHGFVLVGEDGAKKWSGEYPNMYITADDLLQQIKDRV